MSGPSYGSEKQNAHTATEPMEASLTAAASAPPTQFSLRNTKLNPVVPPRRLQSGPSKIRASGSRALLAAASASTPPAPGGGLYSAATYELTVENVDCVLDDVRPYLIADGGDVTVASVEDGVISLKLEGEPNLLLLA
jgi:NFU1 iron-sulfur cluster scaffold homolog, mitochondrial